MGHGLGITRTDLVAYRTELVVMSSDVVRSRRLVKHGELPTIPTSCYDIEGDLSSSYDISRVYYEYPRVPKTFIVEMSCRIRRARIRNLWQLARQAASYDLR